MRRFRPTIGRSEPENKGNSAPTSNETPKPTAPTRRARIKPKVGLVGNSRTGIPGQRKLQTKPPSEAKRPDSVTAEVIPSINVPLVQEKDITGSCLSNNETELGNTSTTVSPSIPTVHDEQHTYTSSKENKGQLDNSLLGHVVPEVVLEGNILDNACALQAHPGENVDKIDPIQVTADESTSQVEPCLPVLMEEELLLQRSGTCDVSQSVEESNLVDEHIQEHPADNTEAVTENQHPHSHLDFHQLENADDLLQNLLRNENTSLETILHPNNTNVATEIIADCQQGTLTNLEAAAFPVLNSGMDNTTDNTSSDASKTVQMHNSVSGSSLNIKRRHTKPRSKVLRKPENFISLPQLDISEIPIASNVEIDIDVCDSETLAVDHPVLEFPVDLIEDNLTQDHPEERKTQSAREGFRKRSSSAVKLVVSRQGLGNSKDISSEDEIVCDRSIDCSEKLPADNSRKQEVIGKRKNVGPNLTSGGRQKSRRNQPEQRLPNNVPDDIVENITECTEMENQNIVTAVPDTSNNFEDISLSIVNETMVQSLQNIGEPLSTLVECPQVPSNVTSGSVIDDGQELGQTSFDSVPQEISENSVVTQLNNNQTALSCASEVPGSGNTMVESISTEIQSEKQQNSEKVVKRKRKVRAKVVDSNTQEGSEGAQGVSEGLVSQDTGNPTQVLQDVTSSATGMNKRQRKVKPKTPGKRGRRKAADKDSADVTEETGEECEQGTVSISLSHEGEMSAPSAEKDNTKLQNKKKRRSPTSKRPTDVTKQNDVVSADGATVVRKKGRRRQPRTEENSAVNVNSMRISDMMHYNPRTNPMKSSSREETQESIINAQSTQGCQSEITLPANGEEQGEPSVEDGTQQSSVIAPRVTVDADGNIVLDEESLVIQSTAGGENLENREIVFESANQQYRSTLKRKYIDRWDKKETVHFYEILSQIGTDFSLMATIFPKRNRTELKKKFKREEKLNRDLIEKALNQRNPIPASLFAECLEETQEEMDRALVLSPQENVTQA